MTTSINRRSLVKGAAWAAPIVTASAFVPAYAASQCNQQTVGAASYPVSLSGSAHGKTISMLKGDTVVNSYTISIDSSRAIVNPSNAGRTGTQANLNGAFGLHGYVGADNKPFGSGDPTTAQNFVLDGLGFASQKALVLTQSRPAPHEPSTQTVTFTFREPVYSFSMPIYNLTLAETLSNTGNDYRTYQDELTFSVPVSMSGYTEYLNALSGNTFYRTQLLPSTGTGTRDNTLFATFTSKVAISSFSVTYTDRHRERAGWQAIGLGPLESACPTD